MANYTSKRPVSFFGKTVALSFLLISLFTITLVVRQKTNIINKATFDCESIVIDSDDDIDACEAQVGCRAVQESCTGGSETECLSHLGCSSVPDPVNEVVCRWESQSTCLRPDCLANYKCQALAPRYATECSKLTSSSSCGSRPNRCRWTFTSCSVNQYRVRCEGHWDRCISVPVVCTPGHSECVTSTQLKTCAANGSGYVYQNCPTGKTCHPENPYACY